MVPKADQAGAGIQGVDRTNAGWRDYVSLLPGAGRISNGWQDLGCFRQDSTSLLKSENGNARQGLWKSKKPARFWNDAGTVDCRREAYARRPARIHLMWSDLSLQRLMKSELEFLFPAQFLAEQYGDAGMSPATRSIARSQLAHGVPKRIGLITVYGSNGRRRTEEGSRDSSGKLRRQAAGIGPRDWPRMEFRTRLAEASRDRAYRETPMGEYHVIS